MTTEAGPPIVCPRTGRTWPRVKAIDLRRCVNCGGWIDTRVEAWFDGPRHDGPCPEQASAAAADQTGRHV